MTLPLLRWILLAAAAGTAAAAPTHIVAILADDFGWADAGWHGLDGPHQSVTPRMDALVKDGIELQRNCTFLRQ